jgi:beta-xylosidase
MADSKSATGPEVAYSTALAPETGVARRDPSDVLHVDDRYYVWYTRVTADDAGFPAGYTGTVWYATSPDGREWTEQGPALGTGPAGAWDDHGVFTPNVLAAGDRFYLYYTAVSVPFSNEYPDATPTAIGVAVAESPEGPWRRVESDPVLEPAPTGAWDDFRVDDSCLLERDGEYRLYYKGVTMFAENWWAYTPVGVATAPDPTGPFERSPYNPLVQPGHEVCVWPHGEGVAALVQDRDGPVDVGHGLWYGPDGLTFHRETPLADVPGAPGTYREPDGRGVRWGICHAYDEGRETVSLRRFDADLTVGRFPGE